jgi:TolA-binding protein
VIALAIISGYLFLESTRKQEITAWEIAKSTNTIVSYQEYLKKYPTGRYQREALFNQAKKYFKQGNYEKALEKVDEAKRIKETPQLKALEQQIKRAKSGN